jgi:hypothetical protein
MQMTILGKQVRVRRSACPTCGTTLNAASAVGEADSKPSQGDFTLCINCGTIMRFGEKLELILCSQQEVKEFMEMEDGREAIFAQSRLSKINKS